MRVLRSTSVAVITCVAFLTSCGGDVQRSRVQITPTTSGSSSIMQPTSTTTSTLSRVQRDYLALMLWGRNSENAKREAAAHAKSTDRNGSSTVESTSREQGARTAAASPSLQSVMACIKRHESGNYQEQSHLQDGSGAYQFIPSTWRTWSARAGHPGYAYAYQAPAWVQDAVTAYTLTHGGAGNWSNRYGFDPCTEGM